MRAFVGGVLRILMEREVLLGSRRVRCRLSAMDGTGAGAPCSKAYHKTEHEPN
jgi:hypothetical protein